MSNVKLIEYYPNGKVKRVEFFEPQQQIEGSPLTRPMQIPNQQYWWKIPPVTVTSGSTGAMDSPNLVSHQATTKNWCCPIAQEWDTPEEDAAWAFLSVGMESY